MSPMQYSAMRYAERALKLAPDKRWVQRAVRQIHIQVARRYIELSRREAMKGNFGKAKDYLKKAGEVASRYNLIGIGEAVERISRELGRHLKRKLWP